jgi:hypothetical protein
MSCPWATPIRPERGPQPTVDVPYQFSSEQATSNCAFLMGLFGADWVAEASASPVGTSHPLYRLWSHAGPDSFLQLNALAEDLRLLRGIQGFETALKDLKQEMSSKPHFLWPNGVPLGDF